MIYSIWRMVHLYGTFVVCIVRWTIHDIFLHIHSFPKSSRIVSIFIQETSFTEMSHLAHHLSICEITFFTGSSTYKKWWNKCDIFRNAISYYEKMMGQTWDFHEWSFLYKTLTIRLDFGEWIYVYGNVTYGPSQKRLSFL